MAEAAGTGEDRRYLTVSAAGHRAQAANADLTVRPSPDLLEPASLLDGRTLVVAADPSREASVHHAGPGTVRVTVTDRARQMQYIRFFVRQPAGGWVPFGDRLDRDVPGDAADALSHGSPTNPPTLGMTWSRGLPDRGPSPGGALGAMPHDFAPGIYYLHDYVSPDRAAALDTLEWSELIRALKRGDAGAAVFFAKQLDPGISADVVLVSVPSHDPLEPDTGIRRVAMHLSGGNRVDGSGCLVRHAWIPKLSRGGDRSSARHVSSIRVDQTELLAGRIVLLLDDVVTTGGSFVACRQLLVGVGASVVECLALGATSRRQWTLELS